MKFSNLLKLKGAIVCAIFSFVSYSSLIAQNTDIYSVPGTVDWVVPACVTSVTVRAWGAGGAGGGATSTDRNGGGGGGGAYCTKVETVTPGETLRITVGAGGSGGTGNGAAGGLSQVQHLTGAIVFCRAAGGAGGIKSGCSSCSGAGGSGGLTSNNIPVNTGFRGGNGGASDPNTGSYDQSGGGGGGAGTGSNGSNGGTPAAGAGGSPGGGSGGAGILTTTSAGSNGNPGFIIGGGGGGATTYTGSRSGGQGARGQVTITYVPTGCEPPLTTFTYSPAGSYNWVVPVCVNFVTVEAWGGGGGGGGNIAVLNGGDETCTGAGGGGGGGYAARTYAVTPGESYTIVVGAGGTAGPAGVGTTGGITTPAGTGGVGQSSTFSGPATVGPGTLIGNGGNGGGGAGGRNTAGGTCLPVNGAAGLGGTGINGSINYTGGSGAAGHILNHSTDKSGGGGGAAGPGGNGGAAPAGSSVGIIAPPGGIGDPPGGNGGTGRLWNVPALSQQNGGNGTIIGGGGGGSLIHTSSNGVYTAVGGVGAIGEVRLTYNTACPLPVELMHFGGENIGEINKLTWITASEKTNDFFTLERSENGVEWEKVINVKGAGSTQQKQYYSYDDRAFTRGGINYYRLSQTDMDGADEYVGKIIPIDNRSNIDKIIKRYNVMGQEVGPNTKGVIINVYEDGTTEKIYVD